MNTDVRTDESAEGLPGGNGASQTVYLDTAQNPKMAECQVITRTHFTAQERADWNRYLETLLNPNQAYLAEWSTILKRGLQHEPMYLEARREGRIVGILPLALVRSFLFGRMLVSLPYLNVGGPIADDTDIAHRLVDAAVEISERCDCKHLELRNTHELATAKLFTGRSDKKIMIVNLPTSEDDFRSQLTSKVRNLVRKAEKTDFQVRFGGRELLDDFYTVFSQNMRDLGTPVYSKRLFAEILDTFSSSAELCVVSMDQKPTAAALLIHHGTRSEVPSASSMRKFNSLNANYKLYYSLFLRAIERGSQTFDMGRSSEGSGTYHFKQQWRAEPVSTNWQYHAKTKTVDSMRPDNPKMKLAIEVWKRLPVWFTQLVGPAIVRGIP